MHQADVLAEQLSVVGRRSSLQQRGRFILQRCPAIGGGQSRAAPEGLTNGSNYIGFVLRFRPRAGPNQEQFRKIINQLFVCRSPQCIGQAQRGERIGRGNAASQRPLIDFPIAASDWGCSGQKHSFGSQIVIVRQRGGGALRQRRINSGDRRGLFGRGGGELTIGGHRR